MSIPESTDNSHHDPEQHTLTQATQRSSSANDWLALANTPVVSTTYDLDNPGARQAALLAMYTALYSELRDKDTRLKDVVAWGVTSLAGTLFLNILTKGRDLTPFGANVVSAAVVIVCIALCLTVWRLAYDRVHLSQTLNRFHQALGAFHSGIYIQDSTLFRPTWVGWGHAGWKDAHYQQAAAYIILLLLIGVAAILTVQGTAGTITMFKN